MVYEGAGLKYSVYIATSLDGFIARENGSLDWLEGSSGDSSPSEGAEDYGFGEFFESVDTMVMGRGTYEFVANSGMWGYDGKRTIVLSSTMGEADVAEHLSGKIEVLSMEPVDVAKKLRSEGASHVYVDGGVTIQRFLIAGLIDEITITRVPLLLGSGIPLFGELESDVELRLVESHSFENGMVQSRYVVVR